MVGITSGAIPVTPEELLKSANVVARKRFTRAGLLKIMAENEEKEKLNEVGSLDLVGSGVGVCAGDRRGDSGCRDLGEPEDILLGEGRESELLRPVPHVLVEHRDQED